MKRRHFIKHSVALGAISNTGLIKNEVQARSTRDENKPKSEWGEEDKVTNRNDSKITYHGANLCWYGAEYFETRDVWLHDMGLTACGTSKSASDDSKTRKISGVKYRMYLDDSENWNITANRGRDYLGVYPKNSGIKLPEWIEIPIDTAISLLKPEATFAVIADDMAEAMGPKDGTERTRWGLKMNHLPAWWHPGWTDASFFQRFIVEMPREINAGDKHLDIRSEIHQSAFGNFSGNPSKINYGLSFWSNDNSPGILTQSEGVVDTHPENINGEKKKKLGIKKVPNTRSQISSNIKKQNGSIYRATNFPISVETDNK